MKVAGESIFKRYPQLMTLRGLVADDIVEQEVDRWADQFEDCLAAARQRIPTVRLCDIFPAELERLPIRLENFLGHWGNVSIEEVAKLALIARWLKPQRALEIGTYNGMTTLQLALNAGPQATIYTLDLPDHVADLSGLSPIDRAVAFSLRNRFGTARGSYFRDRPDVQIRQLLGESSTFDYASAIDGPVDLVFIDAAHDYKHKQIDSENALRLLSDRGVIVWHNYADVLVPDVTRYLLDFAGSGRRVVHLRGTMLAIYRADGAD